MSESYTPALGRSALTPLYDLAIALLTREGRWRRAFVSQIAPSPGESILDVGCGTGSLALLLKRAEPLATITSIDPDRQVLDQARTKAQRAALEINFAQGFARNSATIAKDGATKAVSSLVFHQVPLDEKRAGVAAMYAGLKPGGELHIADYGLQRTPLMRALFKQVQRLDGFENTTPNARGILPELIREVGFVDIEERQVIPTPTGSISLYFGRKPTEVRSHG
jgi:ubiquinone/menaquinone biosynthesis C-methylase UbiE